MGKTGGQASQTKILSLQRARRILELRQQGFTQAEIAQDLGISTQAVSKRLQKMMAEIATQKDQLADELWYLNMNRLEELLRKFYGKSLEGEYKAVDRCIRIIEMESRLAGLLDRERSTPSDISVVVAKLVGDGTIDEFTLAQRIFEGSSERWNLLKGDKNSTPAQ